MKLFYAAVSAIIVNSKNEILLVSPDGKTKWQTITGWVENETIDEAMIREIKEELQIKDFRLIEIIDSHYFKYDNKDIISTFYLVKYDNGEITANEDIVGYVHKWFDRNEIRNVSISCPDQFQIIEKAFFAIDHYSKDNYSSHDFYKYKWQDVKI